MIFLELYVAHKSSDDRQKTGLVYLKNDLFLSTHSNGDCDQPKGLKPFNVEYHIMVQSYKLQSVCCYWVREYLQ